MDILWKVITAITQIVTVVIAVMNYFDKRNKK